MIHLVIGAGEVGQALYEVLSEKHETYIRDIENNLPLKHADVLHIAFPFYPDATAAENATQLYRKYYEPDLVIIHSTVPIGTCTKLDAVASPVRGRHPNLMESVKVFEKFFGGPRAQEAANYFVQCGVKVAVRPYAHDVEAGKLWELAQYGLNIWIEKHIYEYCQQFGLDFNTVYTDFAVSYNAGYMQLGESQFVRPILKHIPGPIGGHCVVPGSIMLNDPLADFVAQAGVDLAPTSV